MKLSIQSGKPLGAPGREARKPGVSGRDREAARCADWLYAIARILCTVETPTPANFAVLMMPCPSLRRCVFHAMVNRVSTGT